MPFLTHTLPNGLTVIGEPSPAARSAAVGFFVRTGSRDERPDESGVSHFLEHMMFKGTPRRTALDVNLDFDRIGASYNAYTSEENTVYYAAVLPEYLPRAVDILADILRPSLRQADFDTEKQVILEEIGMYEDQPGWAASDHARKLFYGPHPLGNSVLGTKESVTALTRDGMHAYFSRRYAPTNIVVSAAGHFDWAELVRLVSEACGGWERGEAGRGSRTEWAGQGGLHVLTRQKVQQEHVMFLAGGPRPTAASGTPPTPWPWPWATTAAAGCTGRWWTRASRTRPTAVTTRTTAPGARTRRTAASRTRPAGTSGSSARCSPRSSGTA